MRGLGRQSRSNGRDVAQPGSASHWGCGGRRFESYRPDQFFNDLATLPRLGLLFSPGFSLGSLFASFSDTMQFLPSSESTSSLQIANQAARRLADYAARKRVSEVDLVEAALVVYLAGWPGTYGGSVQ